MTLLHDPATPFSRHMTFRLCGHPCQSCDFSTESWQIGLELVLEVGTEGVVSVSREEAESGQVIQWNVQYSAWDLFALLTCSTLHAPGVGIGGCGLPFILPVPHNIFPSDSTPSLLVGGVVAIARLVTQVLKHNWSLEVLLRPITSQYFTLLQKCVGRSRVVPA